jgi:hypothetical protein
MPDRGGAALNTIFFWRLAIILAFLHFSATLSVLFAVFVNVFGRAIGGFAAALKGRPAAPPHEPTSAEFALSILVQPLKAILQALDIKGTPAYLALNSLFWGIVLALLFVLLRHWWRRPAPWWRQPAADSRDADQTASEETK